MNGTVVSAFVPCIMRVQDFGTAGAAINPSTPPVIHR
jgi:hypothetical protein